MYKTEQLSKKNLVWQGIIFLAVAFSAIEAPISLILKLPVTSFDLIQDFFISGLFAVDFILNLKLQAGKGWRKRATNPYFWIDLLSSIPVDIISYVFNLPAYLRILRLVRLLRLIKIPKMFSFGNLTVIPVMVKIPLVIVSSLIAINFIACGWMLIYPMTEGDLTTFYVKAVYWAITTLTTIGYGDITPTTNIGRFYTMIIMILGVGVYGLVIGSVSRAIAIADRYKEQSREKINDLNLFMNYYNIPTELRNATFGYYSHLLTKRLSDNDAKIISELPHALQVELKTYMNMKLIGNVPAFELCGLNCLKEIAKSLEQMALSPGNKIVAKGDMGNEMFIVGHGKVEVIVEEKVVATLREGQFFGEIALLEETVRNADVRSKTYCDLYRLSKEDFLRIIKDYPELLNSMEKFMSNRKS